MAEPDLGAKKLQKMLQDMYNVTIGYDTVWKGKEKVLTDIYDVWKEKFQQLLNWKAAGMENSPDSVIERDMHMVGRKMYFHWCFGPPQKQMWRVLSANSIQRTLYVSLIIQVSCIRSFHIFY
jgi:hypothetical protein